MCRGRSFVAGVGGDISALSCRPLLQGQRVDWQSWQLNYGDGGLGHREVLYLRVGGTSAPVDVCSDEFTHAVPDIPVYSVTGVLIEATTLSTTFILTKSPTQSPTFSHTSPPMILAKSAHIVHGQICGCYSCCL